MPLQGLFRGVHEGGCCGSCGKLNELTESSTDWRNLKSFACDSFKTRLGRLCVGFELVFSVIALQLRHSSVREVVRTRPYWHLYRGLCRVLRRIGHSRPAAGILMAADRILPRCKIFVLR